MLLPPNKRLTWALAAGGATVGVAALWALWPAPPRERIARAARSQLGRSDPTPYWRDVLPFVSPQNYPPDWCGAFGLWAIHQGGIGQDVDWVIGRGISAALPTTQHPLPGDIAYFTNNQHHAVVVGVNGDTVQLINGNGTGGAVSPSTINIGQAAAYYSIEPLLEGAQGDSAAPWLLGSAVVAGAAAWLLLPASR